MANGKKLFSAEEAAEMLGVTKQTVSKLAREERLLGEQVGGRWIFSLVDLEKYMKRENLSPAPADHPISPEFKTETSIIALSFFSGALGLDLGIEHAGIYARLFCENDRKCRMTINSERPDAALIGDITSYSSSEILAMAGLTPKTKVDLMFGGPPCQAFSTAGARRAFDDARGNVFLRYLELIAEILPAYVVIENVRGLLSASFPLRKDGPAVRGGAMKIVLDRLCEAGYATSFNLYNAANFGAAQIRERVVIIGKLGESPVSWLTPTNDELGRYGLPKWRTFREAVEGLEESEMHGIQFPEKRLRWFAMLSEGQYWKNLPEDMQQEAMGKSYELSGGKTGFYRRIAMDKPCPTLVTSPTMPATDLCHPTIDRPLTVEEYKRVQGFPDDWHIRGSVMDEYRQVGNAVPIALGEAIGKTIMEDMAGICHEDKSLEDFPYSRYKRTSDKTWEEPK